MKNLLSFLTLLCFIGYANATVHTVCNNAYSPGQYTSLQAAITAAAIGDSIYVEPSPIDYGSVTVPKKLFLFGGGGQPTTYQMNNRTQIDNITFSTQTLPPATADGSQIAGFYIAGGLTVNGNLSNITIIRNLIAGSSIGISGIDSNIVIANNIFDDAQVYITSNYNNDNTVLIANNFFNNVDNNGYGGQAVFENNGSQDQQQGVQIINNIMYGNSTTVSNSGEFFRSLNNAVVKNNIFYCLGGTGSFGSGCNACDMQNNLTYSDALVTQTLPDGTNTGTGNYNNVAATPFVNGPAAYTTIAANTLGTYNWKVTNTYATAGSDGTPLGIYGGPYPFPNFETLTRLPQMRFLEISNPTVQPGGTLHVNAIGTTHN